MTVTAITQVSGCNVPPLKSRWRHRKSGSTYIVTGWSNLMSLSDLPQHVRNAEAMRAIRIELDRRAKYPPRVHYHLEGLEKDPMYEFSGELSDWWNRMEQLT